MKYTELGERIEEKLEELKTILKRYCDDSAVITTYFNRCVQAITEKDDVMFNENMLLLQKECNDILMGKVMCSPKYMMEYKKSIQEVVEALKGEMNRKQPKIFISHSYQDRKYAECVIDFLEDIGVREKQMFCSSVPGYMIPMDTNINEYLERQFSEYELRIIFLLSKNYYQSKACLNEMGAAWALKCRYSSILLPGFHIQDMSGSLIDSGRIALVCDADITELRDRLTQFREILEKEFELREMNSTNWERKREKLIRRMTKMRQL